jgi:four helix bundle protein
MQNSEFRKVAVVGTTDLRERTRSFALGTIKLVTSLPSGRIGEVIGRQILKSGTSIGANWREACRASSKRHFVTTAEICLREADETLYWLELLSQSAAVKPQLLASLTAECNELVAIFVATVRKAKRGIRAISEKPKREPPSAPTF